MAATNDLTEYEKEERAQAAHQREMEKLAAQERVEKVKAEALVKTKRAEMRPFSIGTIAAMLVVLALVAAFTYGCTRPADPNNTEQDKSQIEQQREIACIDAGGGWIPEDMLVNGDDGQCIFPGTKS